MTLGKSLLPLKWEDWTKVFFCMFGFGYKILTQFVPFPKNIGIFSFIIYYVSITLLHTLQTLSYINNPYIVLICRYKIAINSTIVKQIMKKIEKGHRDKWQSWNSIPVQIQTPVCHCYVILLWLRWYAGPSDLVFVWPVLLKCQPSESGSSLV